MCPAAVLCRRSNMVWRSVSMTGSRVVVLVFGVLGGGGGMAAASLRACLSTLLVGVFTGLSGASPCRAGVGRSSAGGAWMRPSVGVVGRCGSVWALSALSGLVRGLGGGCRRPALVGCARAGRLGGIRRAVVFVGGCSGFPQVSAPGWVWGGAASGGGGGGGGWSPGGGPAGSTVSEDCVWPSGGGGGGRWRWARSSERGGWGFPFGVPAGYWPLLQSSGTVPE